MSFSDILAPQEVVGWRGYEPPTRQEVVRAFKARYRDPEVQNNFFMSPERVSALLRHLDRAEADEAKFDLDNYISPPEFPEDDSIALCVFSESLFTLSSA